MWPQAWGAAPLRPGALAAVLLLGPASCSVAQGQDLSFDSPSTFLRDVGRDFRVYVTSGETYLTLGLGLGTSASLKSLDASIAGSPLNGERYESAALDRTFEAGEVLGGTLVQVGGAVLTYGVGHLTSQPGLASLGRDLVRAQILNAAVTQGLKYTVGRERPDRSSRRSFPSGHASGTFATATVLQRHYGWKVGIPALAVASYVAASRLSENKHYLSDVVFGAAIGLSAGRTVTFRRGSAELHVAPAALAGGVGVHASVTGW